MTINSLMYVVKRASSNMDTLDLADLHRDHEQNVSVGSAFLFWDALNDCNRATLLENQHCSPEALDPEACPDVEALVIFRAYSHAPASQMAVTEPTRMLRPSSDAGPRPGPKRFFRSFWRSLTIRAVALDKLKLSDKVVTKTNFTVL